jgi:hypothetical protein
MTDCIINNIPRHWEEVRKSRDRERDSYTHNTVREEFDRHREGGGFSGYQTLKRFFPLFRAGEKFSTFLICDLFRFYFSSPLSEREEKIYVCRLQTFIR